MDGDGDEEIFDLDTIHEYEMQSNKDGSVMIEDNCVVIKHKTSKEVKLLPLQDEVLNALGLAVVLNEDPKEQASESLQDGEAKEIMQEAIMEVMTKEDDQTKDEQDKWHIEENSMDISGKDGQITIVYTDDEDAELNEIAQTMPRVKKNKESESEEKSVLYWSRQKTFRMLDLYERNQDKFYGDKYRHRVLWKYILTQMVEDFPEMSNYHEVHIQSKFAGMKRTYKGLEKYLKDDLNTTSWPYYARMDKIMEKDRQLRCIGNDMFHNESYPWDAGTALEHDSSQARIGINTARQWQKKWTPLLLDMYEENLSDVHKVDFWHAITEKMASAEPGCDYLTPAQNRQKYFNLVKAYNQYKDLPRDQIKGELKDPAIFERLEALQAEDENVDVIPASVDVMDDSMDSEEEDSRNMSVQWPKSCTNIFLDLLLKNRILINKDGPMSDYSGICAQLHRQVGAGAAGITPAACTQQANALKRKFRKLYQQYPEDRWDEISWPFFQKCVRAFAAGCKEWSAGSTALLIDLYARTATVLDESGPKFWNELARAFREKQQGTMTPRRCEMKMQNLFLRYKLLLRKDPDMTGEASTWKPFKKMHACFGARAAPAWRPRAAEQLLSSYRAHLPRLQQATTEQEANRVWQAISEEINEMAPQKETIDAEGCRDKMVELKTKYCKLMRDDDAARAWPHYKNMSELFSSHLWSKDNVNLLLDIYEPLKSRIDAAADASVLWSDVASSFNARSPTSAVLGPQCQTEVQVLCARYRALTGPAAYVWPFYGRMRKICSQQPPQPAKRAPAATTVPTPLPEVKNEPSTSEEEAEEYAWTNVQVFRLLDSYESHRGQYPDRPRQAIWEMIDKDLTKKDPSYTPDKKGYGAWLKYLDLKTRYMDSCGSKTNLKHWPLYERMEKIIRLEQASGTIDGPSDADSDTDNLEHVLTVRQAQEGKGKAGKRPIENLAENHFACVFIPESTATTRVPSSAKRKRAAIEAWSPSEEELLLSVFAAHAPRFLTGDGSWRLLVRQLRRRAPSFSKSPSECENKMATLRARYLRMRRHGSKLAYHCRLPDNVYQKLHSIFGNDPELNQNSKPEDVENGDSHVLNSLLKEIRRKNELQLERHRLMEAQMQASESQHNERMKALALILQTVRGLAARDSSDVIDQLERNLEELHK